MTTTHYTINAAGKTIGRVSSEAAKMLMGKTTATYTPNKASGVKVTIENASKIRVTEKKRLQTIFTHYSQYPGGLKKESLGARIGRKGMSSALRHAIEGMLPNNTLFVGRMKNLTISE